MVWFKPATGSKVVEDWERSSPLSDYNGDTDKATIITGSNVLEGDKSIEWQANSGSDSIINQSGVDANPKKGDTFSCLFNQENSGENFALIFGAQDTNNYYAAVLFDVISEIRIQRYDSGSETTLASSSNGISTGQTYEVVVKWHNGTDLGDNTIEMQVYEWDDANFERTSNTVMSSSLTTTDSTYASETGFGFGSGGSSSVNGYIDWLVTDPPGGDP
jgi:hypothetical protein